MVKKRWFVCIALSLAVWAAAGSAQAQTTSEQRRRDFQQLASLYAVNYAPFEWKRDVMGFDLMDLRPWLSRVDGARNDLEFWDICVEYVSRLQDGHSQYNVYSPFYAYLPLNTDIYDGRVLIDDFDPDSLPEDEYPFQIGDEIVALDGTPVNTLIEQYRKYGMTGNPRATQRSANDLLTLRPQVIMPRAAAVGETSSVLVRHADGTQATYQIPWVKVGTPVTSASRTPLPLSPAASQTVAKTDARAVTGTSEEEITVEPPRWRGLVPSFRFGISPQRQRFQRKMTLGLGSAVPVWALPNGFVRRRTSVFFSGTYVADGVRIGYLRIPDFDPIDATSAVNVFTSELAFMQANTDGLIVDVMRNPGGGGCYTENLLRLLHAATFRMPGQEVRATSSIVREASLELSAAQAAGAEQWELDLMRKHLNDLRTANSEMRGRTGTLPICSPSLDVLPYRNSSGQVVGYTKPIVLLIDEFSASAADLFAAALQDNRRARLVGTRTMGLGGAVMADDTANYSEGYASATVSLVTRSRTVTAPGFPATTYIENVGVAPDLELDYMTRENLVNDGRPFVAAFTQATVEHIRNSQASTVTASSEQAQ